MFHVFTVLAAVAPREPITRRLTEKQWNEVFATFDKANTAADAAGFVSGCFWGFLTAVAVGLVVGGVIYFSWRLSKTETRLKELDSLRQPPSDQTDKADDSDADAGCRRRRDIT